MTRRILIASAQEDFDFPLAEAARKQIFAQAERYREHGSEVEVLIISGGRSSREMVHDVPIRVVPKHRLPTQLAYCYRFDTLHFFGTTGLVALAMSLQMPFRTRYLTVTDGGVFSIGRRAGLRRFLAKVLPSLFDGVFVYTAHQQSVLESIGDRFASRIVQIQPILSGPDTMSDSRRSTAPSILYMGHLSYFKGVDIVTEVFRRLAANMPGLQLTLASNGLDYGDGCRELVFELMRDFPGRVHLKGKIDPYAELGRAHLLLHPFRQQAGTFAFPLALYEALLCGTPFLSSDLDGPNEFFDGAFLCPPGDIGAFCTRADEILRSPGALRETMAHNLKRIVAGSAADEADRIVAPFC